MDKVVRSITLTVGTYCTFYQGCGYGCQIHHAVYCFITAYGTKRTMILNSKVNFNLILRSKAISTNYSDTDGTIHFAYADPEEGECFEFP